MIEIGIVLCAFIIDLAVGDPRALPHPVVGMGYAIRKLEQPLRSAARTGWLQKAASPLVRRISDPGDRALRIAGMAYPLLLVGGSFAATWLLLYGLSLIHPWLAYATSAWLISTTVAAKGLGDAGMEIYRLLKEGNMEKARYALSMIVGRDTDNLSEGEITRGAVETVAENIVDAILSPLFYALIGGAPLAMAYRAANTLDSMVGYKNDKYIQLGWASARFDDLANWIPARLSALFIAAAAWLLQAQAKRSLRTVTKYARLHPSPNSGYPESAVAGALGIQLGGLNYYKGVASDRARMGEPIHSLQAEHIRQTVRLMYVSSALFVVAISLAAFGLAIALF
ncbi:adenosylcobinamide-phosphate synthase CbiB [Cohnella terricola]|uniref:Cobalamin biosynthesis protein CobD n=1 Tax=Cohnella terricola TaxID=1289167 RepID=A0A559JX12_9BACL|nr:adenosylcobinamide-phosphate synthase CbiB [Cohnella terricola]TVY04367.1 cobalamin biosynthesis protein CobD [Cohnella terricola]